MARQNHIFTKIRTGSQAEKLANRLSRRMNQSTGRIISTVSELDKAGMALKLSCGTCGEEVTLAGRKLKTRFGSETLLQDIDDPCTCGSRAVSRIPVSV